MNLDDYQQLEKISQELFRLKNNIGICPDNHKCYRYILRQYLDQFQIIIEKHARPYLKFSNYADLIQDGWLALALAEKSYRSNKGSYTYWAEQYIKTKIVRKASRHSLVKLPLAKAKKLSENYKVYFISSIETKNNLNRNELWESLLNQASDSEADRSAERSLKDRQTEKCLYQAIDRLDSISQKVISSAYQLDDISSSPKKYNVTDNYSKAEILESLSLTEKDFNHILKKSKLKLKKLMIESNA